MVEHCFASTKPLRRRYAYHINSTYIIPVIWLWSILVLYYGRRHIWRHNIDGRGNIDWLRGNIDWLWRLCKHATNNQPKQCALFPITPREGRNSRNSNQRSNNKFFHNNSLSYIYTNINHLQCKASYGIIST
jgi:hypothetical protein